MERLIVKNLKIKHVILPLLILGLNLNISSGDKNRQKQACKTSGCLLVAVASLVASSYMASNYLNPFDEGSTQGAVQNIRENSLLHGMTVCKKGYFFDDCWTKLIERPDIFASQINSVTRTGWYQRLPQNAKLNKKKHTRRR